MTQARIAADLRRQVESRDLRPGDRLPSEPQLARAYGVSAVTARNALRALVSAGIATVRRGKGYFVREYRRGPVRAEPGHREAGRVAVQWEDAAPDTLAEDFPAGPVLCRRSVADGQIRAAVYPARVAEAVPELARPVPLARGDVEILGEAGHNPRPGPARVIARMPSGFELETLGVSEGTPVLERYALVYGRGGVLVAHLMVLAGDRWFLEVSPGGRAGPRP